MIFLCMGSLGAGPHIGDWIISRPVFKTTAKVDIIHVPNAVCCDDARGNVRAAQAGQDHRREVNG
jgi:hypothetical protein